MGDFFPLRDPVDKMSYSLIAFTAFYTHAKLLRAKCLNRVKTSHSKFHIT